MGRRAIARKLSFARHNQRDVLVGHARYLTKARGTASFARVLSFLRAWATAIVSADSAAGTLTKLVLIVAAVVGLPIVLNEQLGVLVWVPAWAFVRSAEPTLGWTLFSVLALIYLTWLGGTNWARSRGPALDVSKTLIADTEFDLFRLHVRNSGEGILTPAASLLWIDGDGFPDHEATMPVPLRWMHLVIPNCPQLSWHQQASVDIVDVRDMGTATERLEFAGQYFKPHVLLRPAQKERKRVVFCIRVYVPGTRKRIERVFTLQPDPGHPFGLRPVRLRHMEPRWWGRRTSLRESEDPQNGLVRN